MNVVVVMPYRGVDDDREQNLAACRKLYDDLGWPVYLGDHEGEFTTAIAKNVAATQAIRECDPDVLFVTDSDLMLRTDGQVVKACETALERNCYVIAYNLLCYLTWEGTSLARAGEKVPEKLIEGSVKDTWGGSFAISRTLWERVGGYDPRFYGYGHDDIAFTPCANTMGTDWKQRVPGRCYHLMHPETDKSFGQEANARIASRYRAADGDRAAMVALLAERCLG